MTQERRKRPGNDSLILDAIHIVTGILIVIFAVLAFLNPDENRILFPAIFFLAAILNLANGSYRFRRGRGKKKERAAGAALMTAGGGLALLGVLSLMTIWWG